MDNGSEASNAQPREAGTFERPPWMEKQSSHSWPKSASGWQSKNEGPRRQNRGVAPLPEDAICDFFGTLPVADCRLGGPSVVESQRGSGFNQIRTQQKCPQSENECAAKRPKSTPPDARQHSSSMCFENDALPGCLSMRLAQCKGGQWEPSSFDTTRLVGLPGTDPRLVSIFDSLVKSKWSC